MTKRTFADTVKQDGLEVAIDTMTVQSATPAPVTPQPRQAPAAKPEVAVF